MFRIKTETFSQLAQRKAWKISLHWSQVQPNTAKCTLTFNLSSRYQSEIRSVKTVQEMLLLFSEDLYLISSRDVTGWMGDGRLVISLIVDSGLLEFGSFVIQHWFTVFIWPLVGSYTGPVPFHSAWLLKKRKKVYFRSRWSLSCLYASLPL